MLLGMYTYAILFLHIDSMTERFAFEFFRASDPFYTTDLSKLSACRYSK